MKTTFFKILLIIFFLFLYILISALSYVKAFSNDFYSSFFRLHVIANSNSKTDQELKLKVRDSILTYINSISSDITTKSDFINLVSENNLQLQSIAQNTIYEQGYNYPVELKIENSYFPTRYYSDFALPSGYYDTLKILIGNHSGENWWCVMFPPICFISLDTNISNSNSEKIINNTLNNEEYNIIYSKHSLEYDIKFKLLEKIQNFKFLQ